jgi:hypothetical protein
VALKVNIAASQLGKTPIGFGELIFQRPGNLCDNMTVEQIAAKADTVLTYWQGHVQGDCDSLYSAIQGINRAFAAPLDTLSFEADNELILNGSVDLSSVPFLSPGLLKARRLHRTTSEVDEPGEFGEEDAEEGGTPVAAKLYQNYPNPFNPSTAIGFRLSDASQVTIRVFDILGSLVVTLASDEEFDQGYQEVEFTAEGLSSGVYFYRIDARSLDDDGTRTVATNKMLLLK